MPELLGTHFWLLCGVWVGGLGSISVYFRLRKAVHIPEAERVTIARFSIGWFAAIMIPCVLLWLIQLSSGPAPNPDFFTWPMPQRWLALAINFACWTVLLWWVWLSNGAERLSELFLAFARPNQPRLIYSPGAIKLFSVLIILSGIYAIARAGWGVNG